MEANEMFTLPESGLADLSDDALRELEAEGRDAFNDLDISEDSTAEQIAEAEAIADAVDTVRGELANRAAAATERAEKIAALSERMADKTEDTEEEPPAEGEEPVAEEEDEEPEMATEEAAEVAASDETPDTPVVEDTPTVEAEAVTETPTEEGDVAETTEQPEAVAAAASPSDRAAQNAGTPSIPKAPAVLIASAAPDVPDFSTGQRLDGIDAITAAVTARLSGMDRTRSGAPHKQRLGAVRFTRTFEATAQQDTYRNDDELLNAVYASALENQSLVAAAGWGAPSETMYDLCTGDNTTDGTLSIPEFAVSRGGIRYTSGTDFSVVDAAVGFDLTEAEVEADTPKSSYTVPDPTFTDVRLDAVGVVVRAGLLQRVGYPEQIADVIQKALIAHQHKVSAKTIGIIDTAAGAALTPVEEGALSSTLDSLLFAAESHRQDSKLADSRVFEVLLAHWVKPTLKAEIGRRTARPGIAVSDAEVMEYFSSRNLAVQFVYGLDDLTTPAVAPKATTPAIIYPAGTWMRGVTSVANLDTIYDSTLLNTNEYTALFTEEGVLAVQKCLDTNKLTIPVSASGRTGAATLDQPFGTVEA